MTPIRVTAASLPDGYVPRQPDDAHAKDLANIERLKPFVKRETYMHAEFAFSCSASVLGSPDSLHVGYGPTPDDALKHWVGIVGLEQHLRARA